MNTRRSSRWMLTALTAILLLASFLRIHNLNAQGLWGDEGWSIWLARGDSVRDLTMSMVNDRHSPLYGILLRGWENVAGESVLALRFSTVLVSILSIALLYRLGHELFGPTAGIFAALIFTLMDKHVVLTQEVRGYPLLFLTMIAITVCYVRWRRYHNNTSALTLNPSPSWRGTFRRLFPFALREKGPGDEGFGYGFGFVAFSIFGLYLHYFSAMINLAILAHALLTLRDWATRRNLLALNGLIALAFLPWAFVAIHQNIYTPEQDDILKSYYTLPFNRSTVEYLAKESLGTPLALNGMLMLIGIFGPMRLLPGSMSRIRRDKGLSGALLVSLWFGLPVIIIAALHNQTSLLTDRNISVIMPAIALLAGFGLTAFERFGQGWLVALILVNGLFSTSSYYIKPPWRTMADDIAANYPRGEPVLVDVEGEHAALWYHLLLALPGEDGETVLSRLPDEAPETVVSLFDYRQRYQQDFLPHVKAVLDTTDGLWLAYWGEEFKKHDVFDLLAGEGFIRTATMTYAHLDSPIYAYRYDRSSALDEVIAPFGDSIKLRKVVFPATAKQDVPVQLWWSTNHTLPIDYTVSVFLLDESGALRAQHDGLPANGTAPTSAWTPDSVIFDGHTIALPDDLLPGEYRVGVKLYTWWDGAVLSTGDDQPFAIVGTITIR